MKKSNEDPFSDSRRHSADRRAICIEIAQAGGTAEEAVEAIVSRLGVRVSVRSVSGQLTKAGMTFALPPARLWLRRRLSLGPIAVDAAKAEVEAATGVSVSAVILRSWAHQDGMRFSRNWSEAIGDRIRDFLAAGASPEDTRAALLSEFGCAPELAAIQRQMRPCERKRSKKKAPSSVKRISEQLAERHIEPWEAAELLIGAGYSNAAVDVAIIAYWSSNVNLSQSLKRHADCEAQAARRNRKDAELRDARASVAEMGDAFEVGEDWMRMAA